MMRVYQKMSRKKELSGLVDTADGFNSQTNNALI